MADVLSIGIRHIRNTSVLVHSTRKAIRYRNLRQARTTPPARNGSRDVIDDVTSRFPICHFL